jgi:hypothetical protein
MRAMLVKGIYFGAPNVAVFFTLTLFLPEVPSWEIAVINEIEWEPMLRPRAQFCGPFANGRQIMTVAENYRSQFYVVVRTGTEQFCVLKKQGLKIGLLR